MTLPPSSPRTHAHTRKVEYRGYAREDGLWDIEAELIDTKTYALARDGQGLLQRAGQPVHHMLIRITVDDAMKIQDVATTMASTPFTECQAAAGPMSRLIGVILGPGWRQAIEHAIGGQQGCTHLRELLFGVATAAYQTIPNYREQQRISRGEPAPILDTPPYHLGKCLAWDFDGTVVKRMYPQFAGWRPLKKSQRN